MESLRVFEASARHCNFTQAATELGVTPTAVSLRVRDLEAELGQSLFLRNGPRIALTETGAQLAERLSEVMAITRAAVAASRAASATLRLTVTPTFGQWLAARLPHYHALPSAPGIRLDVSPELRPANRFDVAIRSGYGGWPGMQSIPLLPVLGTPMLSPELASKTKLRTPADLQRLPLLPDVNWKAWFRQVGVREPELRLTPAVMPTQDMTATAAVRGTGVALLSPVLFADLLAEQKLVRPFEQIFVGPETYYVVRPTREDRPATEQFIDWVCAEIAAEWSGGGP